MKIAIGADHRGFELKEMLIKHLQDQGHQVQDMGTDSTMAVDYPQFARLVAQAIAAGRSERGVMIDGTGTGSCMVANKVPGARAVMAYDLSSARNGREHNDANLLTLGAGLIEGNLAAQIVDVFLTTECTESRHQRRVATATGGAPEDLARYIDHTILKPDATRAMIDKVVAEAREYRFRSVCVNPCWVRTVAEGLRGSDVLTCSVVGFPLGANTPEMKGLEARQAIADGAQEIDMVINVGRLKDGDDDYILRDIRAVTDVCREGGAVSKVIIETALLTDEEKVRACELSRCAHADFVKTSTGFSSGGATAEDIALMASVVHPAGMEVKASGGIRSFIDAKRMIDAGATRIGASAGITIVQEARSASAQ
ncbi:deoxyribose-phosphate aldolase [bacterium DOLZORAL124_64_63]|nr:MAG: deoxyribose-phosphate aldolase [bacterium DOLZORAL124_64_63]